jgi:hypothetical protein
MKRFFIFFTLFQSVSNAQVGIGTTTPEVSARLQIEASSSTNAKGFLPPRVILSATNSISPFTSTPATGILIYNTASAGTSPNNVTPGFYYWNTSAWARLTTPSDNPVATIGDVKSGFQSADHAGWVKLNGRAVSTLTSTQQAAAATLGITGSLPNADNAYLTQNGSTIGSVSGSNTVSISQANLPNVNFSGTAASNGSHSHSGTTSSNGDHSHSPQGTSGANGSFLKTGFEGSGAGVGGGSAFTTASTTTTNGAHTHSYITSSDGSHTHTVTVSSGGSGTALSIAPKSMAVNMFIYLGL